MGGSERRDFNAGVPAARLAAVTGASGGLGLAIATALAKEGFHVAVVCRDGARGALACAQIASSRAGAAPDLFVADLSLREEVARLAREMSERLPRLDVLVNNAGVVKARRERTTDGIEWTLAVNHLAPFHLTRLLLPLLEAAPEGRVVNISSDTHRGVHLDPGDLQSTRSYDAFETYRRSKLANVLFTYALARRLAPKGPGVFAVAPGMLATGIVREAPDWYQAEWSLKARPVAEGADTPVWAAGSPALAGKSGLYLRDRAAVDSSPESYDIAAQDALWDESVALTSTLRA